MLRLTLVLWLVAGWLAPVGRADLARDLANIHTESVGGRARVDALKALKVAGITSSEQGDLPFLMWARRPNQIRTEVTSGPRKIVQVWDGRTPPWWLDSRNSRITFMSGEQADEFKAEAEFDNPLLAGADRRISLDYVGEVTLEGRELLKIMVTCNFTEISFVYLDPATYFIVRKDVVRRRQGAEVVLRTEFSDFKPVAGVILPHRLVVSHNGKRLHETVIQQIEPNPKLPDSMFAPPPADP